MNERWYCEDCGWTRPLPGPPSEGAECDNCGGGLAPQAHDLIDAVVKRAHRYAMGIQEPHHFEYGPGGSPYCALCGCSAEGFYHRGVRR